MEAIPVQNQEKNGVCYAYAATQYWDSYRYLKSKSDSSTAFPFQLSSPHFAALVSSKKQTSDSPFLVEDFEGGVTARVLRHLRNQGNCSLDHQKRTAALSSFLLYILRKDILEVKQKRLPELKLADERVSNMESALPFERSIRNQIRAQNRENPETELSYQQDKKAALDRIVYWAQVIRPELSQQEILNQLQSNTTMLTFITETLKGSCSESEKITPTPELSIPKNKNFFNAHDYRRLGSNQYYQKRTQQLNHYFYSQFKTHAEHSLPIPVFYCARLYYNGNQYEGYIRHLRKEENCGQHASLVIGYRTRVNQQSEVLIRNSWGKSCKYYHSSLQCEGGNIWVPVSTLAKNLAYSL